MEKPPRPSHLALWLTIVLVALVCGGAAWLAWWKHRDRSDDGALNVPLGVEQAAIVTYSGPELAVAPYKWGVAVNVRIAAVTEQPNARIYDVRYIVNREGTFDLREYLSGANGSPLFGLPEFKFHGDPKLSKNLDTRIRETEEVKVEIGGHYYRTLALLAVFWIAWLLLLIFYKRPRREAVEDEGPRPLTLAERLRPLLAELEAGTLSAAAKARLEMLLLRHWRDTRGLEAQSMYASLEALQRDAALGETLGRLQRWLHAPAAEISAPDLARDLKEKTNAPLPA